MATLARAMAKGAEVPRSTAEVHRLRAWKSEATGYGRELDETTTSRCGAQWRDSQARTDIHRYYTPRWVPFPNVMDTNYPLATPRAPPRSLDEMLTAARRLSKAIGTYLRIDFFDSAAGAVFNEHRFPGAA